MSTEAKSPPPRGATAILAWAATAFALAQTAVIGAAVAAGIAAFFIPRAAAAAGARARRRGDGGTGRASRLMTWGSNGRVLIA